MFSVVLNATHFLLGVGNAIALALSAYLFLGDWITIGTAYLIFHYSNMLSRPMERFTQEMDTFQ